MRIEFRALYGWSDSSSLEDLFAQCAEIAGLLRVYSPAGRGRVTYRLLKNVSIFFC
jgi:hypothetical protein